MHCLFELTPGVNFNFLLKGKCCRDLYPEDPITSTVSHKAMKTQSKVLKQLRLESGKNRCKICNNFNPWPVTILLTWRKAAAPGGSNASCSQKKRWLTGILARAEMCFLPQLVHFRRWWHFAGKSQYCGKKWSCLQRVIILCCFLMWVRRIQISGISWGPPRRSILSSLCNEVRAVHMSVY